MSDPHHRSRKPRELGERIAFVKARAKFDFVVEALGLDHEEGVPCVVSSCRAFAVKACHDGAGYYCSVCGDKGDMIDLVCIVRDCRPAKACEFLEHALAGEKDEKTGELFG